MLAMAALEKPRTIDSPEEDDALQRLKRDYLPMWAAVASGSAVSRGVPGEVPYADYMKGTMREFDETGEDEPDHWVCNIIEAAILEISPAIPLARAALSVRYVMRAKRPAVYRSGRLQFLDPAEIDDLADRAELALVPVCRRRNLPL